MQQRHVDGTVEPNVQSARLGELRPAVRREVGPASREVKAFDPENLVCHFEANRLGILQAHMRNLRIEGIEIGRHFHLPGIAKRSVNRERPRQSRMARDFSRQVDIEQRVDVQMLERKIQVGGEIVLHPDRALDF